MGGPSDGSGAPPAPDDFIGRALAGALDHPRELELCLVAAQLQGDVAGMRRLFAALYDPAAPRLSRDPGDHTPFLRFFRTEGALDLLEAHYAAVDPPAPGAPPRPLVVLPSQPRSASRFIVDALRRAYALPTLPTVDLPVDGLAPTASWTLLRRRLEAMRAGGGLPHCHAAASPRNLETLRAIGITRLCVTVRDPRQGFFSVLRVMMPPVEEDAMQELVAFGARLTPAIAAAGREDRAEAYLHAMYPDYLDWLAGWIDAADRDPGIRLMRFEDMVRDARAHIETIGRHCGLEPVARASGAARAPGAIRAFHESRRAGETDEFRRALPPRFLSILQELTPQAILDRLDWPR